MDDSISLSRHLIGALDALDIPYLIGGSVAMAVWAVPRTTHDLDIVVDLPAERIFEFCALFSTSEFTIDPMAMLESFQHKTEPSLGLYSFEDNSTGFKVDLFPLRPDDPAQQAAFSRRIRVELFEGLRAAVYAPDDLLVQKLRWHAASESELQLRDCVNLLVTDLRRNKRLISEDYIEQWTEQLGAEVAEAWSRVKAAANASNRKRTKDL